jgi:hypothetical protein
LPFLFAGENEKKLMVFGKFRLAKLDESMILQISIQDSSVTSKGILILLELLYAAESVVCVCVCVRDGGAESQYLSHAQQQQQQLSDATQLSSARRQQQQQQQQVTGGGRLVSGGTVWRFIIKQSGAWGLGEVGSGPSKLFGYWAPDQCCSQ